MNVYSVIRLNINGENFIAVEHFNNEKEYSKRIDSMYSSFDADYDGKNKANREARRLI